MITKFINSDYSTEETTVVTFPSIFKRLESITAIRPRAAHFSNGSTKSGAVGSNSTSADSYWESSGGFSTLAPPVFLDCFQRILVILQATLAVREKITGQYPGLRTPGCSWTATKAVKDLTGLRAPSFSR